MANIVTYIEVRDGSPTQPSLFAMSEARRIAASFGATLYGVLALPPLSNVTIDELAAEVSMAGADRVICFSHQDLAGPTLDVTHGHILLHVAQRLLSPLVLLPAGAVALEIGPSLSIRLGGSFMLAASIHLEDDEPRSVRLRRLRPDGSVRVIDIKEHERPVVASLSAGDNPKPAGAAFAEVELVPSPPHQETAFTILSAVPSPGADTDLASHIVVLHPSLPTEQREWIKSLAGPRSIFLVEGEAPMLWKASPESILWISPGRPWNPNLARLNTLAPDAHAYFLGQDVSLPGSGFKVVPCDSLEQLASILEGP